MLSKPLQLKKTNIPLRRRDIVVAAFDSWIKKNGFTKVARQNFTDHSWDTAQDILFSAYSEKEVGKIHYRMFCLQNSQGANFTPEGNILNPDKEISMCGFFNKTGWDHGVVELRVFASWHEKPIETSFELYKLWMIDWLEEDQMQVELDKLSFSKPLSLYT